LQSPFLRRGKQYFFLHIKSYMMHSFMGIYFTNCVWSLERFYYNFRDTCNEFQIQIGEWF
jgi:hypothetical protein